MIIVGATGRVFLALANPMAQGGYQSAMDVEEIEEVDDGPVHNV